MNTGYASRSTEKLIKGIDEGNNKYPHPRSYLPGRDAFSKSPTGVMASVAPKGLQVP